MNFDHLWQEYKELILVIATALTTLVATLLGQKILPGLWKATSKLWEKLRVSLGRRLSAAEFQRRYLEQLYEEQRFLKSRGIRTHSPMAVELEKVYVSLMLNKPSWDRPDVIVGMGAMLEEQSEVSRLLWPSPRMNPDTQAKEPERLPVGEALRRCPERLAILGGPGTGKTTLLSYLALKFARGQAKETLGVDEKRLPILILLRELTRTGLALTAENLPALCTTPELAKECPEGFFKKRLQDGDCIVLLDGMDEVTTEEERRRVAEQIDDFVTTYHDNRFIVTSRPAGYSGMALTGFIQLDVCGFTDEDVEAFARYWCLAVELAIRGVERGTSEAMARRKAKHEAEELVAAIRANDRVRQLTVNPLLLTIVAMVHRYRTLPNRRVELYDECIRLLLGYRDKFKGINGQLDWACKRSVLERLAYWMHQRGLSEAERAQVEQVIAEALPAMGDKETEAEFLKNVRERSGLLIEQGLGIYGFSHLTFQEYLTASYLIEQGGKGREELLKHLHDPWWLEVTLLYAGMCDATPLIEDILARRDDLFKNNLFLAARCLVDRLNIDSHVEAKVLLRLLEEFQAGEFGGLRTRAGEAMIELGHSPSAPKVVEALSGLLDDEKADGRSAALILGRLGRAEPRALKALLDQLGHEEPFMRGFIAFALGLSKRAESKIVEALVGMLGDENVDVRGSALFALETLRRREPETVETLLKRLGYDGISLSERLALALEQLGEIERANIEVLLYQLSYEEASMRKSAADILYWLREAKPGTVKTMLDQLGDKDKLVRYAAADALGKLGQIDPKVLKALLDRLGNESMSVRESAADALGESGRTEPEVIKALLGLLGDKEATVRGSAAIALGKLRQAEPEVIKALLGLLDDEAKSVCVSVTLALGGLGQAEPEVIKALLGRLGDEEGGVRGMAAIALSGLRRTEPEVVKALLGQLGDEDEVARMFAAIALGELGRAEPEVIKALMQRLGDENENILGGAALALDCFGMRPLSHRIQQMALHIPALLNLLGDEREIEYPVLRTRITIKNLAWQLLWQYNQETGERIYWDRTP